MRLLSDLYEALITIGKNTNKFRLNNSINKWYVEDAKVETIGMTIGKNKEK